MIQNDLVHPASLINAYPQKELFDLIQKMKYKKVKVFVDLKNVLTALFIESVVREIVSVSSNLKNLDSRIFQSCLFFSTYWKRNMSKLGITTEIHFCTDAGRSIYHTNIYGKYKQNREISKYIDVATDIAIKEIRDKNFKISEQICNRIPGVYYYCLEGLESDFLPYYLISRKEKDDKDTLNIICSGDKDLLQILTFPNTIQIFTIKGTKSMVNKKSSIARYVKFNKFSAEDKQKKIGIIRDIPPEYLPAIMACCGDAGDNIPGVNKVGPHRAIFDIFKYKDVVEKVIGTVEELNDRISEGGYFFRDDKVALKDLPTNQWRNVIIENEVVTTAYKLIAFEPLCRWLEKNDTIEKMKRRQYIDSIYEKTYLPNLPNQSSLKEALSILEDNSLEDKTIDELFI